ncbi:hypothetical protein N9U41_01775 [Acidimicrobiaceae bacterium]|nr:hypothetical protein [Acidimicrobiaceae bacterium]
MKKFILSEKYISFLLILSIIYLLIFNIVKYDPLNGYDAEAHHSYIDFFSMYLPYDIKLPNVKDTREFFNPPIPYIFPSIVQVICRNTISSNDIMRACQPIYGLYTQIFQSILYLISIYFYLKIFKNIRNDKKLLDFSLLIFVSILVVNYKTFSMIRGEPYIIFFNSIILYRFYKLCSNSFLYKKKDIVIFGLLIGFLALSRQWAFLLFPAYFLFTFFIEKKEEKITYFKFMFYSFLIGFFISSWFYFGLFLEYGSFTAFNKEPVSFSFKNQPISFYLPFGDEISYIFSKPIRPYFSNQFLPILYSDLWGDYWGYFKFTSKNISLGKNQLMVGDYLARVNIVSLIPTILMILGVSFGFKTAKKLNKNKNDLFFTYIFLAITTTFIGYLWFLIKYPALPTGDTNKATYMIQLFHMISLLSVAYLDKYNKSAKYPFVIFLLIAVYIHNYSAGLTGFL